MSNGRRRNAAYLNRHADLSTISPHGGDPDQEGSIAVLFAFALLVVLAMVGAGIDLTNAYVTRQKLTQTAMLACQYSNRQIISQDSYSANTTYMNEVTQFISDNLTRQKFGYTQTTATPFAFTAGGSATVTLSATVPASFMKVVRINTIPVSVVLTCYSSPSALPPPTPGSYVLQEQFNTPIAAGGWQFFLQNGSTGTPPGSAAAYSAGIAYTGTTGVKWSVAGYCMEQDAYGVATDPSPDGTPTVELDCDNGSGSRGNSSISTQVQLATGNYELRYLYNRRVIYSNYDPTYLCASTAADLSWANDTATQWFSSVSRTNQINVYFDLKTGSSPPTHTTLDGATTLAGSNMIDHCVYSGAWVERSVKITVTTQGTYWLSFAADGTNDSYGGHLSNVRLCASYCPGSVRDNFPPAWRTSPSLFSDNFSGMSAYMSPTGVSSGYFNQTADLEASAGVSGGWPLSATSYWRVAPTNIVDWWTVNAWGGCLAPATSRCITLNYYATNAYISRPFLLVPGYYAVGYFYNQSFGHTGVTGTYCGRTPAAAGYAALSAARATGQSRFVWYWTLSSYPSDNAIAVFASHPSLVSTPNYATFNTAAKYTNPDGSITTSPTYAPNGINLANYNSAQYNALIDICLDTDAPVTRTAYIRIDKPAYYWITFSAPSQTNPVSGVLTNVTLTAVGSTYMASPPTSVAVPVPDLQPLTVLSFTGFSIVTGNVAP